VQLIPSPTARILIAVAATGVIAAAVFREPIAILWLGSILVGMAVARAATGLKVAQARRDGFEMYFNSTGRRHSVVREESFVLEVVLRNRSSVTLHLRDFQVLASPEVTMSARLRDVCLNAYSSIPLTLDGVAARVGHYAVHGLSLRVVHDSGAFEAPLIFINPVQIIVYPASVRSPVRPSLGGISRRPSDAERTGHMSGDSIELRELRAHQPGDALRKIAWKASARRGTLLVRDEELMERQSLWVLLDASSELWAGEIGAAPLDWGIDHVASVMQKHVALGDRVGLGIISARTLAWVPPETGANHSTRLRKTLLKSVQRWDTDRSGCSEQEVARVVLEHMTRLHPDTVFQVAPTQVDQIATAAALIIKRYEFETPDVFAPTSRDRILRQYAATFGLSSPPRLEPERWLSDAQLTTALERCVTDRPTRIVLCSVEPGTRLLQGIARMRRTLAHHRIKVTWLRINSAAGLPSEGTPVQAAVNDAIRCRVTGTYPSFVAKLRSLGIGIEQTPKARMRQRRPESQ
jgi:uncharacterized protein (DUF58 family)